MGKKNLTVFLFATLLEINLAFNANSYTTVAFQSGKSDLDRPGLAMDPGSAGVSNDLPMVAKNALRRAYQLTLWHNWSGDWLGEYQKAWIDQAYLAANFEPAAAKGMVWQNQVWGLPDSQEGIALVYNKNLITSNQIPNPDDFTDLLNKASQFQQTHPSKVYICNQGLGGNDAYHTGPIYFNFGLKQYGGFIEDLGNAYLGTPAALSAAQWIASFRYYSPATASCSICQDMLLTGMALRRQNRR